MEHRFTVVRKSDDFGFIAIFVFKPFASSSPSKERSFMCKFKLHDKRPYTNEVNVWTKAMFKLNGMEFSADVITSMDRALDECYGVEVNVKSTRGSPSNICYETKVLGKVEFSNAEPATNKPTDPLLCAPARIISGKLFIFF